jgi:beta-galactosidase GanA
MGEFHYTRYPRAYWEEELRKIKAAGVQILATYVFWNHHEERAGEFNWNDERDLRAFVDLCGRLGFYVVVRLGPGSRRSAIWRHAGLGCDYDADSAERCNLSAVHRTFLAASRPTTAR